MHQNQAAPEGVDGCGQRLRSAREAAGLRLEDVAERLKMPVRVVRSLEDEDWSRLGAPVFVRGQLRSYSRLLGLGTATTIEAARVGPVEPPALVTHNFIPRHQRLLEQFSRRAAYIAITVALVGSVWMGTRTQPSMSPGNVASLDAPMTVVAGGDAIPGNPFRALYGGFVGLISTLMSIGGGAFMLYYDAPHAFSDDEIAVAEIIAGHIAFAIEHRRITSELEKLANATTPSTACTSMSAPGRSADPRLRRQSPERLPARNARAARSRKPQAGVDRSLDWCAAARPPCCGVRWRNPKLDIPKSGIGAALRPHHQFGRGYRVPIAARQRPDHRKRRRGC